MNRRSGSKTLLVNRNQRNRTRRFKKPQPTVKSVNRRVTRIQAKMELKHVDTLIAAVQMVSDPAVAQTILLNPLLQGLSDRTRLADDTWFTSIQVKLSISTVGTSIVGNTCRYIIFRDKQSNGAAPTFTQLLDNSTITNLTQAPYNMDNKKRFKIIADRRFSMNPSLVTGFTPATGATTSTLSIDNVHTFRRKLSFSTNYGLSNAGTIADISTNSVYILLLSDASTAGGNGPPVNGGIRMLYKDF